MPDRFHDNRDLSAIRMGLRADGLDEETTNGVMGNNWLAFFDRSFGAQTALPAQTNRAAEQAATIMGSGRIKDDQLAPCRGGSTKLVGDGRLQVFDLGSLSPPLRFAASYIGEPRRHVFRRRPTWRTNAR